MGGKRIDIKSMEKRIARMSKEQILKELRIGLVHGFRHLKRLQILQEQLKAYDN